MPGHGMRSLQREDYDRLEHVLLAFVAEADAQCAIVMDRTGRLLAMSGETAGLDGIAFASLAAADFSASDQLARLLGEEECSTLVHQGESRSMYLADIEGNAVLAVLFDDRSTLGLVRLKAKDTLQELAAVFDIAARRDPRSGDGIAADWADAAASEIDRLFSE